jgi:mycothiol synthase
LQTPLSDVVIEAVDIRTLSDAEIAEANAFENLFAAESRPEDPPTPVEITTASLRNIPDFVVIRLFYVRTATGELIASGNATWLATDENKHLLQVGIGVLPPHRRRGIGTALLAKIVEVAEQEGRTVLLGGSNERVPSGAAFAEAVGAKAALAEHTNRLVLADVDRDMIAQWIDDGPKRAPGYSLVSCDGPYPEELAEQIVDLGQVMNTAPRGDIDMEDWHWTLDQMREAEKELVASGTDRWYIAARHDETGQLVGFTELFYNAKTQPETMFQGGTGVRPEHRGHALGKWLKAVNIDRIFRERPEIVDIRTGNADSNDAMLGINKALGFKPYYANTAWQISLDEAKAYVDSR